MCTGNVKCDVCTVILSVSVKHVCAKCVERSNEPKDCEYSDKTKTKNQMQKLYGQTSGHDINCPQYFDNKSILELAHLYLIE